MTNQIFQFKVTLSNIKPPIWRRILLPAESTFFALHVAIQDSMGWEESHLHDFRKPNPDFAQMHADMKEGRQVSLERVATTPRYLDIGPQLGDDWDHQVELEEVLTEDGGGYPRCIAGKRACPPEDCGGPYVYQEILTALAAPPQSKLRREWHEQLAWLPKGFDPEYFRASEVSFTNLDVARKRWENT